MHNTRILSDLIDVLKVEPGVEWPDGQVQVGQLEVGDPGADVSLVGVDTESRTTQAVLLQQGRVHGHGEVLVEEHGVGVALDL